MILELYEVLAAEFGDLDDWWVADSVFERVVGSILTQQTRWENVDRVLREMKRRDILCPEAILALPQEELEGLLKPAGFYHNKAKSLRDIARYFNETSVQVAFALPVDTLRKELLGLKGVGDETADAILLFAAGKPSFVIDAYTKKLLKCGGVEGDYAELKERFERSLPADIRTYQHYHALIIEHGKRYCRRKACEECVIARLPRSKN